jgi:hypothetical protein
MRYFVITPDTTEADLKAQYRKLVKIYHSDHENGNDDKFIEMKDEYDAVLLSLKKWVSITERQSYQAARKGVDEFLQNLGKGTADEILSDKTGVLLNKLHFPPGFESLEKKYMPIIKLMLLTNVNVDFLIKFLEKIFLKFKKQGSV